MEQESNELGRLYEADQRDRARIREDGQTQRLLQELMERDAERRLRVQRLIDDGALTTADDYYYAAAIFQHGASSDQYRTAYELAKRAADLGHEHSGWLAASALDRWLVSQDLPQKYGTQYSAVDGSWRLDPVDPDTTDEERAKWNVPALAEATARAERMTRERAPKCWPA